MCKITVSFFNMFGTPVQGAFDNLKTESIIRGMKAKAYPKRTTTWYGNFLSNRRVYADLLGERHIICPKCGTPQGGCLSARAFTNPVDELLEIQSSCPGCNPIAFADDNNVTIVGIDPTTMVNQIQPCIDKSIKWGKENGLVFGPAKTTVVWFTPGYRKEWKNPERFKRIVMEGKEVPPSSQMTYLGVILDSKVSWGPHIHNKIDKARKFAMVIRSAVSATWGMSPEAIQWIYKAIILPKISYGAHAWYRPGKKLSKGILDKFQRLSRLMLLFYAPFFKHTPTELLEILYNHMPPIVEVLKVGMSTH